MRAPRIGLALGSGAARGWAHRGAASRRSRERCVVKVGIASSIAQMELELMRRLKTALDPHGILNAARVLPD